MLASRRAFEPWQQCRVQLAAAVLGTPSLSDIFLVIHSHQQHDSVPLVIASERIDY